MNKNIKRIIRLIYHLFGKYILQVFKIIPFLKNYFLFWIDLIRYRFKSKSERIPILDILPVITDKFETHPIDFYYFHQDIWCANKIFSSKKTEFHVDIGSTAIFVGIISQYVKTYSIDIRPLPVKIKGLIPKKGNLTKLPFKDNSVPSLSSLCVIEHVGLGRYGDPIDPKGSIKSFKEISRVMKPGGSIYISVPIGEEDKVLFNSERVFTINTVLENFKDFKVVEIKFLQKPNIYTYAERNKLLSSDITQIFGLFHLIKK